jgi:hypothetical protein
VQAKFIFELALDIQHAHMLLYFSIFSRTIITAIRSVADGPPPLSPLGLGPLMQLSGGSTRREVLHLFG